MSNIDSRSKLVMLRIAAADAYCAATEYIKLPRDAETQEAALQFERYLAHPTHRNTPGAYTDDTQMSIAVAETVLAKESPTEHDFADSFVRCFLRDKRDGYARNFQLFLQSTTDGADFLRRIKPTSDKNGAAMRAVPLGFLRTTGAVVDAARRQAVTTHNTDDGIFSSVAVGLMSYFLMRGAEPAQLAELLKSCGCDITGKLTGQWNGRVSASSGKSMSIATVDAAYTSLLQNSSIKSSLAQIINWGGDTDSVAAIAIGLGTVYMYNDMPDFFDACVEPGSKYGIEFLLQLGQSLADMAD